MKTILDQQAKEIASLAREVKTLKNEIKELEKAKYTAYKRIAELTSCRTSS